MNYGGITRSLSGGKTMTAFKAMTWNVENLFRPSPGAPQVEQQRFQRKLALLAGVINQLAPDVIALQEIGGEEPLHDLQQALGGTYPHRALSAFPDGRGIRVAFLSKHTVTEQVDMVDFPPGPALAIHGLSTTGESVPINRMSRGALRIRLTKNGLTVDFITAHLKSKLLSFPRPGGSSFTPRDEGERAQVAGIALMQRTAEAVTLRIQANALLQGNNRNPLLVLGDFNDVPEAQTSLILNGPTGSEIGTQGFDRRDQGDDVRLFNLAPVIPQARRFSRVYQGRGELLDQIFASEECFPVGQNNRRQLPAVDSHIDFATSLPSVGDNPGDRAQEIAPDHAPVTAIFDL
jgi:endonuclease/exonuclease/phosphatase family metal-dependent hydrolase